MLFQLGCTLLRSEGVRRPTEPTWDIQANKHSGNGSECTMQKQRQGKMTGSEQTRTTTGRAP